jgi:hypothetical protein
VDWEGLTSTEISDTLQDNLAVWQCADEFLDNSRNGIAKRFNAMIKEYVLTDPRYQMRLDAYKR